MPGHLEGRRGRRTSDMSTTDSPSPAQRRSMMPERSRIHSSEESIRSTISELGTIRRGR